MGLLRQISEFMKLFLICTRRLVSYYSSLLGIYRLKWVRFDFLNIFMLLFLFALISVVMPRESVGKKIGAVIWI